MRAQNIGDQFLYGPALLVNPVTEPGAATRHLYLPKAAWFDFWSGRRMEGGKSIDAPVTIDTLVADGLLALSREVESIRDADDGVDEAVVARCESVTSECVAAEVVMLIAIDADLAHRTLVERSGGEWLHAETKAASLFECVVGDDKLTLSRHGCEPGTGARGRCAVETDSVARRCCGASRSWGRGSEPRERRFSTETRRRRDGPGVIGWRL